MNDRPYIAYNLVVEPPIDGIYEPLQSIRLSDHEELCNNSSVQPYAPSSLEDVFAEMVIDTPANEENVLIVLDCANIGWSYGVDRFSANGVKLAISYFQQLHMNIRAFLPAPFIKAKPKDGLKYNAVMETDGIDYLTNQVIDKVISLVPAGDSDDAYILKYARENNGFVVSNDHFRDHIASLETESIRLSMKLWLHENRCGYTFSGEDFIINPSSALYFATNKRNIDHIETNFCLDSNSSQANLLAELNRVASTLARKNRPHLLEHILLTRAYLLLEV